MEKTNDILTLADVKTFVDAFYKKVRQDALLAPVFNDKIQDQWHQHLQRMYSFWQTVLLDEKTYSGNPFQLHAELPVRHTHFKKWLEIFMETVDELFQGEKAREAKWRAKKIAEMFESKIEYGRNQAFKSVL